ncbi:nucleoside monophosphate kinase [Mycobacterium sp. SM1]|uniref:bifunctional aminoglycoside phosphotransferase/ATP-binding protein n=1 Tax=Mycobacterium sp. SM1 TaxID=2816243 RepID=UPI001BCD3338|nr:bifunctional aminoglycoside phosphotransferase/ATP-binding protein [Mycobacterium sp. SM1]MBS4729267.1 nucleoside monophosphate kinase [Mycobacterium sp. SM1]
MTSGQAAEVPTGTMSPYAEVHETHTGLVVLVGDKAYKVKKPVKTDFLDFSTADRRERACAREVVANSRLAPESYLGVAHLSDPTGGPAEPVVVMRRYPDARRLATLAKGGAPLRRELADIAEVLAVFHNRGQHTRAIDSQGRVGAISARWEENLAELRRYGEVVPANLIGQVETLARNYIAGRTALFGQRIIDKRIVDGHGDLLADDIFCMPDGAVLLDCLDFDDRLRYIDRIDDAAFLAMDLEFLGRQDLADYFLDTYSQVADDHPPASLKHFYIAYRAVVRSKVDCVRFEQGHRAAAADASRHLALALEHLTAGTVRLALIGGAPGTGKTTLAHALAERVGAEVISTDEVRRELQQRGTITGEAGVLDAGLYRPEAVDAVYQEVIRRARALLTGGQPVILDGTWRDPRQRRLARELAAQTSSALLEVVCWTSVEVAVQRVQARPPGPSDATPMIAKRLAVRDDTWDTAHPIDTGQALTDSTDEAEKLWRNTR